MDSIFSENPKHFSRFDVEEWHAYILAAGGYDAASEYLEFPAEVIEAFINGEALGYYADELGYSRVTTLVHELDNALEDTRYSLHGDFEHALDLWYAIPTNQAREIIFALVDEGKTAVEDWYALYRTDNFNLVDEKDSVFWAYFRIFY